MPKKTTDKGLASAQRERAGERESGLADENTVRARMSGSRGAREVSLSNKSEAELIKKKGKYFYGTGKRKRAIAKVRIYKGSGEIEINNKPVAQYFPIKSLVGNIKAPLMLTASGQKFDIKVMVQGGGIHAQADAVRHGISRALIVSDPLNKPTLKKAGLLTRDSRIKERKKFGLKRARRGPQFSKR